MSWTWKVVLALAVLLPVGGFALGTLAGADDEPTRRETMVVRAQADPGPGGGVAVTETGPDTTVPGRGVAASPGVRFVPEPGPTTPSAPAAPTPSAPVATDPQPIVPSPVDVDDVDDGDDDDDDDDDDDGDDD